jgi:hypothetical protein
VPSAVFVLASNYSQGGGAKKEIEKSLKENDDLFARDRNH